MRSDVVFDWNIYGRWQNPKPRAVASSPAARRFNPDSAVEPEAEARSKPYIAKPIDSASEETSISDACAFLKLINCR